jgi:hypothetical protein
VWEYSALQLECDIIDNAMYWSAGNRKYVIVGI